MNSDSTTRFQASNWQNELSDLVTSVEELLDYLQLPPHYLKDAIAAQREFPLRVPRSYLRRIRKGDPSDPLLLQVLPLGLELESVQGFSQDPLQEQVSNPAPGVIHKYHGRVLFIGATQCAINCRYCFRRHFDYQQNTLTRTQWLDALEYVRSHPEIDEIILSGGDPLSLSDRQLAWLFEQIQELPQIARIRIHSRLPIVLPARISPAFLELITRFAQKTVVVVHCNHPQEIDADVLKALKQLKNTGATLLNQTVLLKSINDCAKTLCHLSKRLFLCGVLPYYLHLLDRVTGTAHFEVAQINAYNIYKELQTLLPGYLVPKLVREEAGVKHKTLIVGPTDTLHASSRR